MTAAVESELIQGTPHRLYRFYDAAGRLLYIGITDDLAIRWNTHRRSKTWWNDVRTMTVEVHQTRAELESAEVAAIKAERPKYNIVHNRSALRVTAARKAVKQPQRKPSPAEPYLRFAKFVTQREQQPHFDPWDYPKTPTFGRWLDDQAYRGDDIGELATELRYWPDALSVPHMSVAEIRGRLHDTKPEKWLEDALDDAEHEYLDRRSELGVTPTWTTLELLVDEGQMFPRKIHIEQSTAAHVQLDRDLYVEVVHMNHGPRSISEEFRKAAEECARAGCGRIWADQLWLSRGLSISASDQWVNLYVPLTLIDAAVIALCEADVNDDLKPLRALTEKLRGPHDPRFPRLD